MTEQTLYRRNFLLHLQERPAYDEPVLLKEPAHEQLTSAQIAQLHNEYAISRQLDNVSGVRPAYSLEGSERHPVLLLKYIQGSNLAEVSQKQKLDLRQKLKLAVEISTILGRIHEAGMMHRDISSGNIMVADDMMPSDPQAVTIIDFGLATTLRQESLVQSVATDVAAGTLAYISPEQTGRMNRAVDYRSDIYSLGVTLYELFTGQLPFEAADAMEMIHAHIAMQPTAPRQIDAEIPEIISEIILTLLAKNAEDRYQSLWGLGADLNRCLDQLQHTQTIESYILREDDFSGRLQIPQRLYGRQAEIEQLMETYDRVSQGNTELLFIAGYSGVGKTALVHEIRRDILINQGLFIEGKFDQLQQTLPYSAWVQAFMQLFNNWLAESETNLTRRRETILDAVGENGQVLIDVISALKSVIGPQPPVPQLGGVENQNRLNYTFNRFVSSLATPEHPLVVFLDDLQWIDAGSLNLIEVLMATQSSSGLLIIGAYRDNEVGADHPLLASQERMSGENSQVRIITLKDLKPDALDHLLADTLQTTVAECRDLGQILFEKTAGNPFYFRQQIYALESKGLLSFDRERRRWTWEEDLQQSLQAGGNVVDLMISKIQTLPNETQQTLSLAACLGNRFDTSTLNSIIKQDQADILTVLNPALQGGLIIRSNGHFTFAHDRIQEAGYALISKADKSTTHLEIGRLLLTNTVTEDMDEEIFSIVGHLNTGRALIDNDSEKIELASLNLMAGRKAKAAAAFSDGKRYIEIGLDLLGLDSWQEQYDLTLSLHNENGDLAALTGQYDQIAPMVNLIHNNAKNILDQVRIYMITIESETAQYNFPKAVEIGLKVLRDLDVEIPTQPTPEDYQRLHDQLVKLYTSGPLGSVSELPEMTDDRALAASFVLASEMSTCFIANPQLFPMITYLGAIFTFEFGLNPWSPFFCGVVALLTFGSIDEHIPADEAYEMIQFGRRMQEAASEMLKRPITARGRTKGLQALTHISPWTEPIEMGIELAKATYRSGFETGDLLYGSYGALHFSLQSFAAGTNLDAFQSLLSEYTNTLYSIGQIATPQWLSIYLQVIQNFKETFPEPDKLSGTYFNEDEWLSDALAANDETGLHICSVNRLVLAYHFDIDEKLDAYTGDIKDLLKGGLALGSVPILYFYYALAKLRIFWRDGAKNPAETMNLADNGRHLMEVWSLSVPSTFRHKYDLITAERARVKGDVAGAISHYERAIQGAREASFAHEEALANELYARFWSELGNDRFASQFMREAHSLYRKWGASAKAEHLAKRYPNWLVTKRITIDKSRTGKTSSLISSDLDILTVLKTSQAIAGEIKLDRLLALLMTSAIENSGAQAGYLLLPEAGGWMIVAQADVDGAKPQVEQPVSMTESDLLSPAIVNYVIRTQETVLLADAAQSGEFIDDPHIRRQEVKSLLCAPLVNQGKTSAVLYLENNLSPDAFSPERVDLLQLLSAQMAISIDNARTRDQLEHLLEERSRALDSAQAQVRSLFENSLVGIALSTFSGQILTVNVALLNILRISEEELMQQAATDFYADPADRSAILAKVREFGSVQEFSVSLVRHDGSSFFGSINMSQIILEGNEVLLVMVEDVTDELAVEQELAAIEEREHLARELHDAVTQTLFSANVLAQSSPRMIEKNPAIAKDNFERLARLIKGALAEMRTLLLELRPSTIGEQSLSELFELLVGGLRAQTKANIIVSVEADNKPPEDVTIAFYRIARESLNNIAKHALAGEVIINLTGDTESINLSIKDDGRGFDPRRIPAGHFGLMNMRERAQKIGADLNINSRIGEGTEVTVSWPAPGKRE